MAAMLAASMLIGNIGAMKTAGTSSCKDFGIHTYKVQLETDPAWQEAKKFKLESEPVNRQIVLTVYNLRTMDRLCKTAQNRGIDPTELRKTIEQALRTFQNDPYFKRVKMFSDAHPDAFITALEI